MNNHSETNFYLENIYDSIAAELQKLDLELKTQLYSITKNKIDMHNVINYFFEIPGKKLRPILTILSAGTVAPEHPIKQEVIELAAALELIHNSSLIHDDIIDDSQKRRGQLTMNHKFNNKIAVLAGDLLYTHAFLIINKINNPQVSGILSECVERMCKSEIKEIISPVSNYEEYISYLDDKTANLMSVCCKCGAILSRAKESETGFLGEFGKNFGISYQLTDDYLDKEQPQNFEINLLLQAKIFGKKALHDISSLPDSGYKNNLHNLVKYVLEKGNIKYKKIVNA